ncbi:MAG: inositol monophosphatase family protein [Odoribacter sp.]
MELNLDQVLTLAIEWAKETGKIQLSYFRGTDLGIQTKSNVYDVVTRADKESEAFLLKEIQGHFPDHAVLGEESGAHDGTSDYRWVIDPLDGTNNYSQGLPIFTVSIGLQYKEETILGVVYAPYFKELYTAIKGQGAYLNGHSIRVAEKKDLAHSVLGTGFPYDKDVNPDNNAANLSAILPHLRGIRRMGSAAYDLCCVAAGFLDGYWELSLQLWDICAGVLIVEEAGGRVLPFRENRGYSIIAGHSGIVEKIQEKIK